MNQDETAQPVFPQARSKNLRSKRALLLIGLVGAIIFATSSWLTGSIITNLDAINGTKRIDGLTPVFLIAFLVLAFIGGLIWNVKFWRRIDEAARRAHLDAFYWGGSISWMVIAPFIVLPAKIRGFNLPFIDSLDMSSSQIFGLGMSAAILVTLIGYGVAWSIWWAKKR